MLNIYTFKRNAILVATMILATLAVAMTAQSATAQEITTTARARAHLVSKGTDSFINTVGLRKGENNRVEGSLVAGAVDAGLGGANWTTVPHSAIDPQIAAGPNRVLISLYDRIYYFNKAGKEITNINDEADKPLLVTSLEDLFDRIRNDANTHLYLPADAPCHLDHQRDRSFVDHNGKTVYNYCLNRFGYDARVLYDEYRDRFVIVASAVNEAAKCKFYPNSNVKARRDKVLVAYSATSDPTDGKPWHLMWFDAVPGESCATKKCRDEWKWQPGASADYLAVTVTRNHLLVSIKNQMHEPMPLDRCPSDTPDKKYTDGFVPLYATVHVWDSRALATGKFDNATCNGICSWVYYGDEIKNSDSEQVTSALTLGQTHGDPYLGDAWFVQREGTGAVDLWHFSVGGTSTKPKLHRTTVKLKDTAFDDLEIGNNSYGDGINHRPLQINATSSLVQRGNHLYYADVGGISNGNSKDASIRVVALEGDANGKIAMGGRHTIFGVAGAGYGSPAMEVNSKGDMVLVYRKVGKQAGPGYGARYLVWKAGDATPPGGLTLADDEANIPCPSSGTCSRTGDHDYVGISLAPQGRVYVMQPYIKADKTWGYAVNYIVP